MIVAAHEPGVNAGPTTAAAESPVNGAGINFVIPELEKETIAPARSGRPLVWQHLR